MVLDTLLRLLVVQEVLSAEATSRLKGDLAVVVVDLPSVILACAEDALVRRSFCVPLAFGGRCLLACFYPAIRGARN